jgi:hypothetical protein
MKAPDFTSFDEDKVYLGFPSADFVKQVFLQHYDDDRFFGGMTVLPWDEFEKKVLATKDKSKKITA